MIENSWRASSLLASLALGRDLSESEASTASEALGGIDRFTFQMDTGGLTHEKLMNAIELIGTKVSPLVNKS